MDARLLLITTNASLPYQFIQSLIAHKKPLPDLVLLCQFIQPCFEDPHPLSETIIVPGDHSVTTLCFEHNIKMIKTHSVDDFEVTLSKLIDDYQIDLLLSICCPVKIPSSPVAKINHHGYNLHPSRLPLFKGPTPLFWQLRAGLQVLGVSLHTLTDKFDSGLLVAQTDFKFSNGSSYHQIETIIARLGAGMVCDLRENIARHHPVTPISTYEKTESYQSFPLQKDYLVDAIWTARHAFNFIRGARPNPTAIPFQYKLKNGHIDLYGATKIIPRPVLATAQKTTATHPQVDNKHRLIINFSDQEILFEKNQYRFSINK